MSNILIVVDRNNPDHNALGDIAAAVCDAGASVVSVDEASHVIEACVPTDQLSVIKSMEGVSYVRSVFTYLREDSAAPLEAA